MKIQKDEDANRNEDAIRDENARFELSVFFIFVGFDHLLSSTISTSILPFFPLPITQMA